METMRHWLIVQGQRVQAYFSGPRRGALLGALLALGLLVPIWWQTSLWYQTRLLTDQRTQLAAELTPYGNALTTAINRRFALLEGLKAFVQAKLDSSDVILEEEFEAFAAGLYSSTEGIRNFSVAPGGVQHHVYPLVGNEKVPGHDLIHDERPNVRADVQRAIQSGEIALSGPYELRQGGLGLVARQAVYLDGTFWGLVCMVLDMPPVFDEAGLDTQPVSLNLALRDGSGQVFYGQSTVFETDPIVHRIELPEGSWELVGVPIEGWHSSILEPLVVFQGATMAIVGLLIGVVYLVTNRQTRLTLTVRQRTREISRLNEELTRELTERKRAGEELRQVNRALRVLSECNQAVVRATEEPPLLHEICQTLVDLGGYRLAWVGFAEQDKEKTVRPVAQTGYEEGYLDTVNITWANTERGRGPTGTAIRTGKPSVAKNILTDPNYAPWRAEATKRGYASSIALPMTANGRTFGALSVYAAEPNAFDAEEVKLLMELAGDLAYGIVALRIRAERKRVEEALWESEEKYRLHFENVSDVIYSIDPEFRVLSVSPSVERLLGYRPEELIGKPFRDLNLLAEEYLETAFSDAMRILAGERISSSVYEFIAKDGTRKFGEVSGAPLVRDGKVAALVSVARDITKRRQLETQLRQAQKMEAIGQLAAGIAHDFNNLLTPISGFAELLLGKVPEGSKEQKYLDQIKIAAERAAALTGQLLLFTRQEEGERHPAQLNSVVEETRDLLKRSIPKEITIELRLEPELWVVEADPSQISQVLMNLCVNACDAMPDGGTLTLETRNITLDEEYTRMHLGVQTGDYVRLSVSDTGCGMSPEVQARLFEPFFTTKEMGKGTGLGLSVVYGIVKGHDGFINVYSQEGRGSTFHVYLPAIEWAVEEGEVEVSDLPTGTETILVVDDEEAVRELGQGVLERCGYTVLMAEDGIQALEVYQGHRGEIALVVLDVVMPQMGGQECLRRLREMDPQAKVLISTGYTAKSLAQELMAEGALGVMEKPFRIHDFAVTMRKALDES
jgi:PAS domain S-box-containing protein